MSPLSSFFLHLFGCALLTEALTEAAIESELPILQKIRLVATRRSEAWALFVACGKCFGFWVAGGLAILAAWRTAWSLLPVYWLAGWRLSNLWHDVMGRFRYHVEVLRMEAQKELELVMDEDRED